MTILRRSLDWTSSAHPATPIELTSSMIVCSTVFRCRRISHPPRLGEGPLVWYLNAIPPLFGGRKRPFCRGWRESQVFPCAAVSDIASVREVPDESP